MIALHAGFDGGRLLVWPEPLDGTLPDFGGAPVETIVTLPSIGGVPVPSTPLLDTPPARKTKPKLVQHRVAAQALDVPGLVEFLSSAVGRQVFEPGVLIGADVAWWATALRLAGALVVREHFLPSVADRRGVWIPAPTSEDRERIERLAASMPAVARVLGRVRAAAPLLDEFLAAVVDHLVRKAAGGWSGRSESIHDEWLGALQRADAAVQAKPDEIARFRAQVDDWQRPISALAGAPYRLFFRLEEPEGAEETWTVRYLLQDKKDPSLLLPAPEVWSPAKKVSKVIPAAARQYLLTALGQASGICPRIEESLRTATPGGYSTDSAGAHEFLSERSQALEGSGFGVLLPAWWSRKGTKLRLTARGKVRSPKMSGGGGLSLQSMVQFEWEIALGGDTLTRAELMELAKLKSPLVKLRGQWVQLTAEEISAALDFWKKNSTAKLTTAREALRIALGAGKVESPLEVEGVRATGWMASLLDQLEGRASFEELPTPDGFHGQLRPYQVRGFSWLHFLERWGLGACLADDMGLGKTIQSLAYILRLRQDAGAGPVLLICPTSVAGNWQKEAQRFAPGLPVMVHHGLSRAKGEEFRQAAGRHAVVISTYSLLQRDSDLLGQVEWAGILLDEAQNIKNSETKQARAARSLKAGFRIALTGTPVENNVGDLWSIMEFLNPGLLGSHAEFKRRFFEPIQTNRNPGAATELKRITGPFILRRLKTDRSILSDLPDKMEMKVYCRLTREQASLYQAVVADAESSLDKAEGISRKGVVLATLSKLKQVCNHPAQFLGDNSAVAGRSGKLARLSEMVEELLEAGDRALIFSQFAEMGTILQRHLQETFGRETLFLHGGVSKKNRDQMVERFQQDEDGPRLFILSLKAGGTGLNLTRANHVFHFDRWWNPAVENQATDRAFRIGQKQNVQVHKFLCMGTLEEQIDEMIEKKKEIAGSVVGTGEGWLTELSTAELKRMLTLKQEAVED